MQHHKFFKTKDIFHQNLAYKNVIIFDIAVV